MRAKQPRQTFDKAVTLRPIGHNVLVEVLPTEQATRFGILLPERDLDRPLLARVLAVGAGRITTPAGLQLPMPLRPGDRIIYKRHSGTEIKVGDKPAYLILELDDVPAVIDKEIEDRLRDSDDRGLSLSQNLCPRRRRGDL